MKIVFCNHEVNMKSLDTSIYSYQIEIEQTAEALRKGFVILYPTDTVWGLGCDIENKASYERIVHIKKCPSQKGGFVVLMNSIEMLKEYVPHVHPRVETLLTHYQRPLTIIYNESQNFQDHLLSHDGSIAIRVVNDEFCRGLIRQFGKPIIGTLASTQENHYPLTIDEIESSIIEEADYQVNLELDQNSEKIPSLIATQNSKGELEFIRE